MFFLSAFCVFDVFACASLMFLFGGCRHRIRVRLNVSLLVRVRTCCLTLTCPPQHPSLPKTLKCRPRLHSYTQCLVGKRCVPGCIGATRCSPTLVPLVTGLPCVWLYHSMYLGIMCLCFPLCDMFSNTVECNDPVPKARCLEAKDL